MKPFRNIKKEVISIEQMYIRLLKKENKQLKELLKNKPKRR